MSKSVLPLEVETAFFPQGATVLQSFSTGMINTTLLVEGKPLGKVIVQRLSPIFEADLLTEDYEVIAHHLEGDGWEAPQLVKTTTGENYTVDVQGHKWRAFIYLESDATNPKQLEALSTYGVLLGKLHNSLQKLDYQPAFSLKHFHDAPYHAEVLQSVIDDLPTDAARVFAKKLLYAYHEIPALPQTGEQLIHGDPRTDNILHRDGQPFTFIDWDTLMRGTIWMDIGDMLRSLAENAVTAHQPVPMTALLEVAEGYRQTAQPQMEVKVFHRAALVATQTLALELAMRFVADYQEGAAGYFTHHPDKYPSRHAENMANAQKQWKIFIELEDYLKGDAA